MPALLLALSILSISFPVRDISGRPVAGASVCGPDGFLLAVTDSAGIARIESQGTVTIAGVGCVPWTGTVHPGETVYLDILPVPSGLVVVSAPRPSLRDRIPSTTFLGRSALDGLTANGLESLPSEAPGVVVREYGGAASVVSVSVRGADPSQTSWLVDGHPMNAPTDGLPSGLLDPSMFGAMELARGGASGVPGGGMAATVNLVPEPAGSPGILRASVDDRGGRRLLLRAGLGGLARVSLSAARRTGEAGSTGDEAGFLCTVGPGAFSGGILVGYSSGGVESPDWAPPTDAVRGRRSGDAWASFTTGRLRFRGGVHTGTTDYCSTEPDTIESRLGEGRLDGGMSCRLGGPRLSVEAGLGGLREWSSGSSADVASRDRSYLTLQATRLGRLSLLADFSADFCRDFEPLFSARLGASAPFLDSLLAAGASLAASGRRPTFNELYWPADGFAEGDSTLGPERSLEAGLDLSVCAGPARASAGLFAATVEDLILWAPSGDGIWRPANIGRVEKAGLELTAGLSLGPLTAGGTTSLLEIVDAVEGSSTEGCQLPYRPWATWGFSLSASVWRATAGLGAFGNSSRYINAANTHQLPAYEVASFTVEMDAGSGISLLAGCRNLFDERYEESNGFPGMGRVFRLEVGIGGEGR